MFPNPYSLNPAANAAAYSSLQYNPWAPAINNLAHLRSAPVAHAQHHHHRQHPQQQLQQPLQQPANAAGLSHALHHAYNAQPTLIHAAAAQAQAQQQQQQQQQQQVLAMAALQQHNNSLIAHAQRLKSIQEHQHQQPPPPQTAPSVQHVQQQQQAAPLTQNPWLRPHSSIPSGKPRGPPNKGRKHNHASNYSSTSSHSSNSKFRIPKRPIPVGSTPAAAVAASVTPTNVNGSSSSSKSGVCPAPSASGTLSRHSHDAFPRRCFTCNVMCNSEQQWTMHINGKKHQKLTRGDTRSQSQNITSTPSSASTTHHVSLPSDPYVVEIDGRRKCTLCGVDFTSEMCEISHIQGKRHQLGKRGEIVPMNTRKRKLPTVSLGRCDLCDVDFTSESQRDSHVTGKKHIKNLSLVKNGQPPRKKPKSKPYNNATTTIGQGATAYNAVQHVVYANMHASALAQTVAATSSAVNGTNLLPHEVLQHRVEEIYKQYTAVAKTGSNLQAQQLYCQYQATYDEYIKAYNAFAKQYAEQQQTVKAQEQTSTQQPQQTQQLLQQQDQKPQTKLQTLPPKTETTTTSLVATENAKIETAPTNDLPSFPEPSDDDASVILPKKEPTKNNTSSMSVAATDGVESIQQLQVSGNQDQVKNENCAADLPTVTTILTASEAQLKPAPPPIPVP